MSVKLRKRFFLVMCAFIFVTSQGMVNHSSSQLITLYRSSNENFPNPERGFYFSSNPDDFPPGYPLKLNYLQKLRSDNISLVRRYYLLSEFRDRPISKSFLKVILEDFETSRKAGIKLIIRFTYNWLRGGSDAPRFIILSHIEQLKPILQNNYDVIAYMEAGFIGYWGEWHNSTNNLVESDLDVTEDAKEILAKILSALPSERMIAIRYAKQKKQIFDHHPLKPEESFSGSDRSRTGYHNDSFRSGVDDGGTYSSTNSLIIEQEKAWLNLDTRYVVQGGEPSWPSNPPEYDDCPGALVDFSRMHWDAMSITQVEEVYQGWREQGCMEEIKLRLGYRFRLVKSVIPEKVKPGSTLSMKLEIVNDGWSNTYNPRQLELILRDRHHGNEYYLPLDQDPRQWMPGVLVEVNVMSGIPESLVPGQYQVLLNLPDPTPRLYNRPEYSIRLANQDVWEDTTGYNSLLESINVDPNTTGDRYVGNNFFKLR